MTRSLKTLPSLFSILHLFTPPLLHSPYPSLSLSPADAIIGVSFFGDADPDDFARFDRSFVALFKILAGDSWVPGLSQLNEDGSMNLGVVTYMCSYRLVVEWILLQVTPHPTPCWARSTKVQTLSRPGPSLYP